MTLASFANPFAPSWKGKAKTMLLLVGLSLLAGCATDRPLAFTCQNFEDFLIPITSTQLGEIGIAAASPRPLEVALASTLGQRTQDRGALPRDEFLVLSGGGQWGAFGSGFLNGWSDHGSGAWTRPDRFNVVTGVSTGALQATFAFLGRDYDDELASAYAITSERQLLKRHGAGFFLAHGSMTDTAPLNTYLREKLRPLLDQVAAPEHAGRKLLVGLVNGLDGRMYAADLTRIAAERSGQEREECYTAALLASASVPVVFRQTTINGRPYLDGGVRQSVFVTEVQEATSSVISAADRTGAIYVLMNGDVAPKEVASLPAKLLPTLNRLRTIVFNQVELSSIFSVAQRFPRMATYVATAAGQNCDAVSDEESEIFQPATMRCLSDYGYRRWKEGSVPWTAYDRPDIQPEPLN